MSIGVVIVIVLVVAMATAMGAMALRLSGAKKSEDKAIAARVLAEATATRVAKEFGEYRLTAIRQLDAARKDAEDLEDDLENCTTPGSRRERLRGLVSKLAAAAHTA